MALLPTDYLYAQTGTTPKKTTVADLISLAPVTTIADDLTSTSTTEALSAAQGKVLKDLIDGLGGIQPVPTIPARNALTGLDAGDVIHVADDGDGKWARYQVVAVTDGAYATSTVVKISDEDALSAGLMSTNLGYTSSPSNGTVTNTSGSDSVVPAVDAVNAGLMLPADKIKSDLISATSAVNLDNLASSSHSEATKAAGSNPIVIAANQVFSFDISPLPNA